ncbi:MAG: metallophosphoesterase [Caldilineaceae bacterium]|nr:metallophosphoesterase [Caldilinea sp.]MCB0059502.1 metallophosphoesterase [Caldilineaceae bacterium]MCB0137035.1 metallophosphoesterase [Caldilineaceae bacterium]HRW50417.1 metallophosphoesterase family protein [Caldilinea sp.]
MYDPANTYTDLVARVGETHLRQRLTIQVDHAGELLGRGRTLMHIENAEWLMIFIYYSLKVSGLYPWARRNCLDIQCVENDVFLPTLPRAFDGFTLLHLSDLHLDIDPELTGAIVRRLQDVSYDLCVVTGDFRASSSGSYNLALEYAAELVRHLKPPVYAILGNHDFIEFVPPLEAAGYTFLLNETVVLEREGARLYLSGVDDPHFYETDNLHSTRQAIPAGAPSILLAHSPEIYRHAAASGYDFMLSGHTHAGQICLPGRVHIQGNAKCPRYMIYGPWRHGGMQGYTSAGTGSCGVPARIFCPPEVTLHHLHSL